MYVRHPRALEGDPPQIAVDVNGSHVDLDADGIFEIPDDARPWLERFAAAHGVDAEDLVVEDDEPSSDTCQVEMSDGETCGRELPCRYHSDAEETEAED